MGITTTFRNIFTIFLVTTLFTVTANAQTVIFSEDFASADSGNNTSTSGQNTAWTGNENFTVDANSKAYEAGGAVKLGTGSAVGYITSAPLDLSQGGGNFTLSFDVKGWTTVEGSIKVIITNLADQSVTYTATMATPYETKTLNLTGGMANSTIRIETTAKRAFIDNVTVTVPETLEAPVATAATDITYHSFTAHWDAVAGASYYIIEISTTPDFSTILPGWNDWQIWSTSQGVNNLTGATTYYYRVIAMTDNAASDPSNVIEVTTECGPFTYPADNIDDYCGVTTVGDLPLSLNDYHWYASETGGEPLTADTVISSGIIYYTNYFDNCESPRQPYLAQITIADVPVIEDNEVEVCHSGTIADITPDASGYQWYADAVGGTALTAETALENGTLYVSRISGNCESERVEITVEIEDPAMPEGDAMQDFTEGETLSDLDVVADEDLVWYADEDLTTVLPDTTMLEDNITYYAVNLDGTCMSAPFAVTANQTAGTDTFGTEGLKGYPNPVTTVYSINFTDPVDSVIISNMLGQVVMTGQYNTKLVQIDMAGYPAGTYFIKVTSGARTATAKVVKQ